MVALAGWAWVGGWSQAPTPSAGPSSTSTLAPEDTHGPTAPASTGDSDQATPGPTSAIDAALAGARIDGGDWEITHEVTSSDTETFGVGDRTIRVYRHVMYVCAAPPCSVTLATDDPSTIDKARPARFQWHDGAYVSVDRQKGLDRCVARDGTVVSTAFDEVITTTLQVIDAADQDGRMLATRLRGHQVREATPRPAAAAHGCERWRVEFASNGQRNITPGQATTVSSGNWAGYSVRTGGDRITRVRGAWTQPAITCGNDTELSSFWIGIDGNGNDTLEQLGTSADCENGAATYEAWWETVPEFMTHLSLRVHPGDRFVATIESNGDRYTMTLVNRTTGKRFAVTVNWPRAEGASAEWIAEATSRCPGGRCKIQVLPDFGAVRFTSAMAATSRTGLLPISAPTWELERDVMTTGKGRTKAEVSELGTGGDAFTVRWRSLSGQ